MLAVEETTRWLAFAALKETYSDNPEALDEAAALLADNFKDAMKDGIPLRVFGRDICLRLVPIGVKGDWPFLISVGHLERHFRRAPRKGESQLSGYGVCHICCGGLWHTVRNLQLPSTMGIFDAVCGGCLSLGELESFSGFAFHSNMPPVDFPPRYISQFPSWTWKVFHKFFDGGSAAVRRRRWSGCPFPAAH